jgi:hypothetical protein
MHFFGSNDNYIASPPTALPDHLLATTKISLSSKFVREMIFNQQLQVDTANNKQQTKHKRKHEKRFNGKVGLFKEKKKWKRCVT